MFRRLFHLLVLHFVTLTWNASTTPNVKYHIYRHDNATFPSKIYANAGIDLTYTDENVLGGHTYWYWVTAYDKNGESAPLGPIKVNVPED